MNYCLPKGFTVKGVHCGIKKNNKTKKDLGLIFSSTECSVAGVATKSTTAAACIAYDRKIFSLGKARAVIVNSGNANAFTGKQGEDVVYDTALELSKALAIGKDEIIVASTGIIGRQLPLERIVYGIELLKNSTEKTNDQEAILAFSEAIKTTDLTDKIISKVLNIKGQKAVITGVCKGSGMIHPNMATMLAFVITDIAIPVAELTRLTKQGADRSFNMITVDGDTSTNDLLSVMANGQSGINYQDAPAEITQALQEVLIYLAKEIARDGEGASKLIEVTVTGAESELEAARAAKQVALSPLVKTAVYGESDNIGRVIASVGAAEVAVDMHKISVNWSGLKTKEVFINVDLGMGTTHTAKAWGCDLTEKYIAINTDYN